MCAGADAAGPSRRHKRARHDADAAGPSKRRKRGDAAGPSKRRKRGDAAGPSKRRKRGDAAGPSKRRKRGNLSDKVKRRFSFIKEGMQVRYQSGTLAQVLAGGAVMDGKTSYPSVVKWAQQFYNPNWLTGLRITCPDGVEKLLPVFLLDLIPVGNTVNIGQGSTVVGAGVSPGDLYREESKDKKVEFKFITVNDKPKVPIDDFLKGLQDV